jgi:hypothetical protein
LNCSAEYISHSGPPQAGADNAVLITGICYQKGVYLLLECNDYGAPGHLPNFNFKNKHVELFFPLSYDQGGYKTLTVNDPLKGAPYIVIGD